MSYQTHSYQRRAEVNAILARIAGDPAYRRQIQANPGETIATLGQRDDAPEVVGYATSCKWTCNWTCKVTKMTK